MLFYIMLLLIMFYVFYFFFFKQKTAYEMRISDWSSDVCSSDLSILPCHRKAMRAHKKRHLCNHSPCSRIIHRVTQRLAWGALTRNRRNGIRVAAGRQTDRKSVV